MMRWLLTWILLSICSLYTSSAQEEFGSDPGFEASSEMERLLEGGTQDEEEIELADLVGGLEHQALELNEAGVQELEILPGMSPFLAREIVLQRSRSAGFRSVDDLLAVPGMSREVFRSIRPFVVVRENPVRRVPPNSLWKRLSVRARIRISHDLQKKRGFQDGRYRGSRPRVYQRFVLSSPRRLEAGLLLEKDQGEREANDFLSGYLQLQGVLRFSNLVLGDYQIEAGQGVVLWGRAGIFRGGDPIAISKKSSRGIIPYRSVDENRFLRGLAGTFKFGNFEMMGFYSFNRLDALVREGVIFGFPTTGYHRTSNEMSQRRAARERVLGGRVIYWFNEQSHLGVTAYSAEFDKPISTDKLHRGLARRSSVIGVDFESSGETLSLFGEWARARNGASGGVTGVILGLEHVVAVSLLFRSNPKMLLSSHGLVARQSSGDANNDWGVYFGLRVRPTNSVVLSAYFDLFRPRKTGSRSPFPSWGHESFLQGDISLRRYIRMSVRYDFDSQVDSYPTIDDHGRESRVLVDRSKRNLRLTFVYEVGRQLMIRSRAELVQVTLGRALSNESGMLLYHEVKFRPDQRTALQARVIFFDTDSFDSRLYEFESDVRGAFSNPGLFGRGRRWYLLVRYKITGFLELSAKYAETYRDDVKTIGSGAAEILSNIKSRANFQLDVKL